MDADATDAIDENITNSTNQLNSIRVCGTFVRSAKMVIIIISLKFVERTLTLQVIMSSMLDAINYLLLLPAVACFSSK